MKYKQWLSEWLINFVRPSTKVKTYVIYSELCERHIIPKLGNCNLDELIPLVLQHFVTELSTNGNLKTGDGLSTNTVNTIVSIIRNSLQTAFDLGLSTVYFADKIKRPRTKQKQVDSFSKLEQKKIENAVLSSGKPKMKGIIICLYTGLRIGELMALEWSDVDLRKKELVVSKTCHDGKDENGIYRIITDIPKTFTSCRTIPIPSQIIPLLKELKTVSKSSFIIANGNKQIYVRSYQRAFNNLLKKLNIPHKGFHALRHTFATRAIECGMDLKTLSEILGHRRPTITLERYAHSMPEHKKNMMNRVGKLL